MNRINTDAGLYVICICVYPVHPIILLFFNIKFVYASHECPNSVSYAKKNFFLIHKEA